MTSTTHTHLGTVTLATLGGLAVALSLVANALVLWAVSATGAGAG